MDATNQNTQGGGFDWNGPFQIADDGVRGYFSFLSTKAAANAASKTPPATYLVFVGGALLLLYLVMRK